MGRSAAPIEILLLSQLLSLYTTPVLDFYLDRLRGRPAGGSPFNSCTRWRTRSQRGDAASVPKLSAYGQDKSSVVVRRDGEKGGDRRSILAPDPTRMRRAFSKGPI